VGVLVMMTGLAFLTVMSAAVTNLLIEQPATGAISIPRGRPTSRPGASASTSW